MLEFIRRVRDIFRLVRAFDHSGVGRNAEALSILDTLESKWARSYLAAVLLRGTLQTLLGQHRESRACLLAAAQHIRKAKLSGEDERDYLTAYAYQYWQQSAEQLGIRTMAPQEKIAFHVEGPIDLSKVSSLLRKRFPLKSQHAERD